MMIKYNQDSFYSSFSRLLGSRSAWACASNEKEGGGEAEKLKNMPLSEHSIDKGAASQFPVDRRASIIN